MCECNFDFDMTMLSNKEVQLLIRTSPKECGICEWIINRALFKTSDDNWWISIECLEGSEIEHLEQIIKRKLFDGVTNSIL